jgi:hypothetical protein
MDLETVALIKLEVLKTMSKYTDDIEDLVNFTKKTVEYIIGKSMADFTDPSS